MRRTLFFFWLTGLSACGSADLNPPLPQEKAARILRDVHLAENLAMNTGDPAARSFSGRNPDSIGVFYRDILHHHGLSRKAWEDALAWYREHPAELDSVYNQAIVLLGETEAAAMKKP